MNKIRIVLCTVLVAMLGTSFLVGCSACGARTTDDFYYSRDLDENGHWEGITATDYVTMFDYDALKIPAEVHQITDEAVQESVEAHVAEYATTKEISNRPAQDGDTVNVDYVGTINGEEFEGGSTNGEGTDIIIGTSDYIDDFIDQLIGHNVGDKFEIEATFPEDYDGAEVSGMDAVFDVTINSISETILPELDDNFVAKNLSEEHGWKTVDEMKKGIREDLQKEAIKKYIDEYLSTMVEVSSIPEVVLAYQEDATKTYYESYAKMYSVTLDEFLQSYIGVESMQALLDRSQEDIRQSAVYSLAVQAVAEDANIEISDEDIAAYFEEYFGEADYSTYEADYGRPYIMQIAMNQAVLDLIEENAVLA